MIVRRKKFSLFLGFFTFCMALSWVGLVALGFILESKKTDIKELKQQKVLLQVAQENPEPLMHKVVDLSLVIDDDGALDVRSVYNLLPQNTVFGLSTSNRLLANNMRFLQDMGKTFLIKLPLSSSNGETQDICVALKDPKIVHRQINALNFPGTYGFYHLGDDLLLSEINGIEEVVNSTIKCNVKMFYGVENKTMLLQYNSNPSLVGAFDLFINGMEDKEMMAGLKALQELLMQKQQAIVALRINESTAGILNSWYNKASRRGINIAPLS